ncbi:MAG: helix-turn-helix transcriptional regulator, partial [Acidobacteriota bacterium]
MEDLNPESLRYILGVKLRQFRQERGLGLKETAQAAGMSVSYLSEIEKGRKYPKTEKILQIARALEVSYDELVSPKMSGDLDPVRELFASPFLQEFPFHFFGLEPESIVQLVTEVPAKAGALLRTFLEVGRTYDLRTEQFLFAALRSYQQLHGNHFEDIERRAADWLEARGWSGREVLRADELQQVFEGELGDRVEDLPIDRYPELADLRSVWVPSAGSRGSSTLLINPRLQASQKAFALGRELGYRVLGLDERSTTSVHLEVESFDRVINDFSAAYFSGALLIQKPVLVAGLEQLFARPRWSSDAFLDLLLRHRTTPETFFYRLSQVLPGVFGFRDMYFLRFSHRVGRETFRLSKVLNMTALPIPLGIEPGEHYCRRWPGLRLLGSMSAQEAGAPDLRVAAQRSRFLFDGASPDVSEYLTL